MTKQVKTPPALDRLVSSLGSCLTPESARRVLALKADRKLQTVVDDLAARYSEGKLSPAEEAEYRSYVSFSTMIAILKSKARQLLAGAGSKCKHDPSRVMLRENLLFEGRFPPPE